MVTILIIFNIMITIFVIFSNIMITILIIFNIMITILNRFSPLLYRLRRSSCGSSCYRTREILSDQSHPCRTAYKSLSVININVFGHFSSKFMKMSSLFFPSFQTMGFISSKYVQYLTGSVSDFPIPAYLNQAPRSLHFILRYIQNVW